MAFVLLLVLGGRAAASIVLESGGCDGLLYRADVLHDLLALEGAFMDASGSTARVRLRSEDCSRERGVLEVEVVRGPNTRRRVVLLDGSDAESRARVAALVIAELVLATPTGIRALDEQVASDPEAPTRVAQLAGLEADSSVRPPEAAPREDAWRVQLGAAVGGAYFPDVSTGVGSLRVGARLAAPPNLPWIFELSLRGATGTSAQRTGEASIHRGSLQLGVLAFGRGEPVELGGGVELDVGMAWVSGRDESGTEYAWLDPVVLLSARGALTGWIAPAIAFLVDVRVGWVLLGTEVRAEERALIGASGPMFALEVGALLDLL